METTTARAVFNLLSEINSRDSVAAALIVYDLGNHGPAEWGLLASVFIRVVLQHLFQGYPLAMPAEVLAFYWKCIEEGTFPETPLFECQSCGYGLPRTFKTCPLCGGAVGLGAHSLRQSAGAYLN